MKRKMVKFSFVKGDPAFPYAMIPITTTQLYAYVSRGIDVESYQVYMDGELIGTVDQVDLQFTPIRKGTTQMNNRTRCGIITRFVAAKVIIDGTEYYEEFNITIHVEPEYRRNIDGMDKLIGYFYDGEIIYMLYNVDMGVSFLWYAIKMNEHKMFSGRSKK